MKFAKRGDRLIVKQDFDKEKITIKKGGIEYNVYDSIQAANVDTDPKEVLKKYHCTIEEGIELMQRKGGMAGIYGEFTELQKQAQTIPDLINIKKQSDALFEQLPTEVKQKYGNNLDNFFKDLTEKASEKIAKEEAPKEEAKEK